MMWGRDRGYLLPNPTATCAGGRSGVSEVFDQSHSMVSRTWTENRSYVMENSARDNDGTMGRGGALPRAPRSGRPVAMLRLSSEL